MSLLEMIDMVICFRRMSMERVVNPLENDFFNELDFEESPPFTLVLHGLHQDWMEQVKIC